MPSNILNTDVMFPQLTSGKSTEQQLSEVLNYLFMLREQLRYSLSNLGVENINPASFDEIANIITEPVYVQLKDAEGNTASLMAEVDSLSSRLTDTEGNVSSLIQTTTCLTSRVQDAEGNISTLQQTSVSMSSTISSLSGEVTEITQTVNGLSLSATNGTSSSTLRLLANGIQMSSTNISFSGMVTFTDLSSTSSGTVINGGNITTGTISAITIEGCTVTGSIFQTLLGGSGNVGGELEFYYLQTSPRYLAAGMRLDNEGSGGSEESQYRLFIYTNSVYGTAFALKLESAGGMSLEAGTNVYISAGTYITLDAPTINLRGTVNEG